MAWLRWFLLPLEGLYRLVVALRNRSYDREPHRSHWAPLPVVSIGNLTTGGTGKTPLTLYLAQQLQTQGLRNVVISRGYRGHLSGPVNVESHHSAQDIGDEAVLMHHRLGPGRVIISAQRLAGIELAHQRDPQLDLVLLDDAFQHRAVHRDLDLLVVDGKNPFGNGHCLPVGPLREPVENARRAHLCVVTRSSSFHDQTLLKHWWSQCGSSGPQFFIDFAIHQLRGWNVPHVLKGEELQRSSGFVWSALGHPEAFETDLKRAGQKIVGSKHFRDHASLSPSGLIELANQATSLGASYLICTEKDAVKLSDVHRTASSFPIYIAEQTLTGGEPLVEWIHHHLKHL